jgi:phage shock protein B
MDIGGVEMIVIVAVIIFLYQVIKLWLRYRYETPGGRSPDARRADTRLQEMARQAKRIEERLSQIERILDKDTPGWDKHR